MKYWNWIQLILGAGLVFFMGAEVVDGAKNSTTGNVSLIGVFTIINFLVLGSGLIFEALKPTTRKYHVPVFALGVLYATILFVNPGALVNPVILLLAVPVIGPRIFN